MTANYRVYHHISGDGYTEIVAKGLTAEAARAECERLNLTECDESSRYTGSGHYYTTDAPTAEAEADAARIAGVLATCRGSVL